MYTDATARAAVGTRKDPRGNGQPRPRAQIIVFTGFYRVLFLVMIARCTSCNYFLSIKYMGKTIKNVYI